MAGKLARSVEGILASVDIDDFSSSNDDDYQSINGDGMSDSLEADLAESLPASPVRPPALPDYFRRNTDASSIHSHAYASDGTGSSSESERGVRAQCGV